MNAGGSIEHTRIFGPTVSYNPQRHGRLGHSCKSILKYVFMNTNREHLVRKVEISLEGTMRKRWFLLFLAEQLDLNVNNQYERADSIDIVA